MEKNGKKIKKNLKNLKKNIYQKIYNKNNKIKVKYRKLDSSDFNAINHMIHIHSIPSQ